MSLSCRICLLPRLEPYHKPFFSTYSTLDLRHSKPFLTSVSLLFVSMLLRILFPRFLRGCTLSFLKPKLKNYLFKEPFQNYPSKSKRLLQFPSIMSSCFIQSNDQTLYLTCLLLCVLLYYLVPPLKYEPHASRDLSGFFSLYSCSLAQCLIHNRCLIIIC